MRQISPFDTRFVRYEYFGRQSLMYIVPKIWGQVSSYIRNLETVTAFKHIITQWKQEKCRNNARLIYRKLVLFNCKTLYI